MAALWVCSAVPSRNQPFYRNHHLFVDLLEHVVILDNEMVRLTRMQYRMLALLVKHAGEAMPRAIILKQIWGDAPEIRVRTVDAHIGGLRRKLGVYAEQYIETVIGIGYRLRPFMPSG